MLRLVFRLTVSLILASGAHANGISISQSLDKDNIAFTDSALFEITLEWEGPQIAYLFDRPLNPGLEGLRVARFASSIGSSIESGAEITTKKYQYVLEPIAAGTGKIEPVTISFVSWPDSIPGQLVTEAATVGVGAPIIKEQKQTSLWWVWLMAGVVVVGVAALFVVALVRRSRREVKVKKTPREALLEELAAARSRAGYDMKQFQTDVYRILVTFVRDACNIDAGGLSGEALAEQLTAKGVSADRAIKLSNWLAKAEKDKYIPASGGPGETVRLESELREFFEKW